MSLISCLAQETGWSEAKVQSTLADASRKYKVFAIPKRGGAGRRMIAQPAKDVKTLQRAFVARYPLPVHPCVMSYRQGRGIRDNAQPHAAHRFLLKTDFQNFFHSIKPENFCFELLSHGEGIPEEWLGEMFIPDQAMTELLFWRPAKRLDGKRVLSIGAPSSPMISNFCLYSFDVAVADWCEAHHVTYTRYADDLTFSTNEKGVLQETYRFLRSLLKEEAWSFLTLNEAKTVFASKRTNRHVTGLVINNEGRLSLGRKKKRRVRSWVYRATQGVLTEEELASLKGYLNFAAYADPGFVRSLEAKFSPVALQKIRYGT